MDDDSLSDIDSQGVDQGLISERLEIRSVLSMIFEQVKKTERDMAALELSRLPGDKVLGPYNSNYAKLQDLRQQYLSTAEELRKRLEGIEAVLGVSIIDPGYPLVGFLEQLSKDIKTARGPFKVLPEQKAKRDKQDAERSKEAYTRECAYIEEQLTDLDMMTVQLKGEKEKLDQRRNAEAPGSASFVSIGFDLDRIEKRLADVANQRGELSRRYDQLMSWLQKNVSDAIDEKMREAFGVPEPDPKGTRPDRGLTMDAFASSLKKLAGALNKVPLEGPAQKAEIFKIVKLYAELEDGSLVRTPTPPIQTIMGWRDASRRSTIYRYMVEVEISDETLMNPRNTPQELILNYVQDQAFEMVKTENVKQYIRDGVGTPVMYYPVDDAVEEPVQPKEKKPVKPKTSKPGQWSRKPLDAPDLDY